MVAISIAARFQRDGIVFPLPVLEPEEVSEAVRRFDRLANRQESKRLIGNAHLKERWVWDLAIHPSIIKNVESILGPEIAIFGSLLVAKEPGDTARVPWHQDGTESKIHETRAVTAWIALSEAREENGCMRVIPGTHDQGRWPHFDAQRRDSLFRSSPEIDGDIDASDAIAVSLAPGEMSLHNSNLIHGSEANLSPRRRVNLIVRYVDPTHGLAKPRALLRVLGSAAAHGTLFRDPPAA